jgi:hypothetical protein
MPPAIVFRNAMTDVWARVTAARTAQSPDAQIRDSDTRLRYDARIPGTDTRLMFGRPGTAPNDGEAPLFPKTQIRDGLRSVGLLFLLRAALTEIGHQPV